MAENKSQSSETPELHCQCDYCESEQYTDCATMDRIATHVKSTMACLHHSDDVVKLIVGPNGEKVSCHRLLLAFFSGFFAAAFYGKFQESKQEFMNMPEDNPENVRDFVSWCYTGHLNRKVVDDVNHETLWWNGTEKLWVLGDRIDAPEFMNDAIFFVFDQCRNGWYMSAARADYVYDTVPATSKLRRFVSEWIRTRGPLQCETMSGFLLNQKHRDDWKNLLNKGGDIVTEHLDGFTNDLSDEYPWQTEEQTTYLEEIEEYSVEARIKAIEAGLELSPPRKRSYPL